MDEFSQQVNFPKNIGLPRIFFDEFSQQQIHGMKSLTEIDETSFMDLVARVNHQENLDSVFDLDRVYGFLLSPLDLQWLWKGQGETTLD